MKNLLAVIHPTLLPNMHLIINGQGRVNRYITDNNPAQFNYRPDVDVSEWLVKTSFDYNNGEVCGVITEPGPLTLALQQHSSILIHDLDRCSDSEVFGIIKHSMIAYPSVQFDDAKDLTI